MPPRGRPRSFDRDAALEKAMLLFWSRGYEATSISDLTEAMGIGAPSLYAAFGDKATLFAEVVRTFGERYGGFSAAALAEEPTAADMVTRILREAAYEYTREGCPHGCLVTSAGINTTSEEVAGMLRDIRNGNIRAFAARIQDDIDAGLLPADANANALARYVGAVMFGMSQSAMDGATRAELIEVAEIAARNWVRAT
ncbi:TetR/AcrR family transcriptional regulator [Nocardia cyriacigeorgica]|uniref:TetR/AcrR family transcriptional regulator n=1 Tax=Nocardia cyriacigeorgica TaxID=135487 RepID=A0A5R8NJM8_9NOCA|nr:TetR/AcrR family transcriptional regulator [Nocardia cyriacigeorgica]TLF74807.1 TetR/AcrR family transcriptional regulator [Nocardia cyriacigeorgica]